MRKSTTALTLGLVMLLLISVVPQTASAWTTNVSHSGIFLTESQSDIIVKVKNTDSQNLVVTRIVVVMDWPSSSQIFEIFSGSVAIAPQEAMDFSGKITIPDIAADSYSLNVSITGRLLSETFAATNDYAGSVTVDRNPQGSFGPPELTALVVLVAFIIIIVVLSVWMTKRRAR